MAEVRRATLSDIPALVDMGAAMHAESPRYRGRNYNPDKIRRLAEHLVGLPDQAALLVASDGARLVGMFVAVLAERWFGDGLYLSELAVYVRPEVRGGMAFFRLVRAAERWAQEQGVADLAVGVSTEVHPQATVRAYERLGYTLTGYTMTKTLSHGG